MSFDILRAWRDQKLFGPFFKAKETWANWLIVIKAIFGLPLDEAEMVVFSRYTGRTKAFTEPVKEAWLICGRRGGKSFIAALIATFLAAFRDYSKCLSPGETAVVLVLAVDKDQAKVIMKYVTAFFDTVPMLKRMVIGRTTESLDLSNGVSIEVHSSNFRGVRGRTIVAAICDEISFWRSDDSASPDKEVLNAIRPGMATIPNALLLCLSSPYARRGALYEAHEAHFGNDDSDVLVWRAPTKVMNPTISDAVVRRAFHDDPEAARSEYGDEDIDFRGDVRQFLDDALIDRAIRPELRAVSYQSGRSYVGHADPSGGRGDSFTLAIAHREPGDRVVLDKLLVETPPFDPSVVVERFAETLAAYGLSTVTGDDYGSEFVVSLFSKCGITYERSLLNRSQIYLESLHLFASDLVELLDHAQLVSELRLLERKVRPGGRDSVNHSPRAHDDCANSVCGALVAASKMPIPRSTSARVGRATTDYDPWAAERT